MAASFGDDVQASGRKAREVCLKLPPDGAGDGLIGGRRGMDVAGYDDKRHVAEGMTVRRDFFSTYVERGKLSEHRGAPALPVEGAGVRALDQMNLREEAQYAETDDDPAGKK